MIQIKYTLYLRIDNKMKQYFKNLATETPKMKIK